MSYVMLEGTEDRTLDRSIGRIHGTGVLGKAGNIAIAGHRNTQFCKLEWFERGDKVILTSPHGRFRNEVEWALVSEPDHLEVLDSSHGPASTLVTCFPFDYVVAAPLRYIVRALPDEETESQLLPLPLPSPESNPIKASQ
jgi:sortase A